jgi:hypothetical protein
MKKYSIYKSLLTVFCLFWAIHLSAAEALNVATGKTATVLTGATASGSSPARAVDGDESSYWQSTTVYKHALVVDLGARYDISTVVLKWDGNYFATTLDLLYSETLITTDNVNAAVRTTVSREFGYRSTRTLTHGRPAARSCPSSSRVERFNCYA